MQGSPYAYSCFIVTTRCNASCDYCYRLGPIEAEVTREAFARAARTLNDLGCRYLTISGGEPLLHPDWRWMIEETAALGMRPILTSNGSLLKDLTDPALKLLDTLSLPLDGGTARDHEHFRPRGSFAHVTRLIDEYHASEHSFTLKVNTVVTQANLAALEEFPLDHLNDPRFTWKLFQVSGRGALNATADSDQVDTGAFLDLVRRLRERPDFRCRIEWLTAQDTEDNYLLVGPDCGVYVPTDESYRLVGDLFGEGPRLLAGEGRAGSIVLQGDFAKGTTDA